METKPGTAVLILPGLKSLASGIVGHYLTYRFIVVLRGLNHIFIDYFLRKQLITSASVLTYLPCL